MLSKKYILVGPIPPPLGGVSVFVYRYAKILQKKGFDVHVVDLTKVGWVKEKITLLSWILSPEAMVFHLNGGHLTPMVALLLRPFRSHIIFHDHSGRFVAHLKGWQRVLFKLFLKKVDECQLVGEHLKDYYIKAGIVLPAKTLIKNAFVAPPPEDEESIWKSYDTELKLFVEKRSPLIIANAAILVFHEGYELYGLDMCIDLIARLKETDPSVGLVVGLAEITDSAYYEELKNMVVQYSISENVFFVLGQKQIWPIFKHADLMVRPTNTDGDAVSIREALSFGCPVVASDACQRPDGTHVFKCRDNLNFFDVVKECLSERSDL